MTTLILLRHGQSVWNLQNRFTGFEDVDLSLKGVEEAAAAGHALAAAGLKPDITFTSTQRRAYETARIVLEVLGCAEVVPMRLPDLRERDYGALTGQNKDEAAAQFGAEQVHIWRRSYDIPPLQGESLKDVVENRVRPFYAGHLRNLPKGEKILIAAHGNSLRALLIVLGAETPESINAAEIATGTPIVLELDAAGHILSRRVL